jgi:hypothetical protein
MSFQTVVNALPYLPCVSVLPRLFDVAILAVIIKWGAVVWHSKRMGSEETGWKPVCRDRLEAYLPNYDDAQCSWLQSGESIMLRKN